MNWIKILALVVSVILTLVSFGVLLVALCTIEVASWSWGGFFALAGSVSWLVFAATLIERNVCEVKK